MTESKDTLPEKAPVLFSPDDTQENALEDFIKMDGADPAHMIMANAGHQMRAPLTTMFSALRKLSANLGDKADTASRQYLSMLQQNCFRLLRLSNNLTQLPLLETGQISLNFRDMELVSFTEGLVRCAAEVADYKKISLSFICHEDAVPFQGDPEFMERMLYHLLSNAIKLSPPESVVTLAVSRDGDNAVLRISGPDRDETEMDLDTLYKLYETKILLGAGSGMGLGLQTAHLIARHHGGQLRAFIGKEHTLPASVCATLPLRHASEIVTLGTMAFDYAGNFRHELLELSDAIPSGYPLYLP